MESVVLYLKGNVDSNNAAKVEEELLAQRNENKEGALIIDCKDLKYISSAGLRIILRLKKAEKNLSIINVSSEVYEIFEMTGFTEMMDVKKALRKISLEGCTKMAEGANGVVYRVNPETIMKVFKPHVRREDIDRELSCAKQAFVSGIPTAISFDVVDVDGSFGVIYELLNAEVLSDVAMNDLDNLDKYLDMYVDLAKVIHSTDLSGFDFPSSKEIMLSRLEAVAKQTSPENVEVIKGIIESLPDAQTMIHGDFHLKNIMMQNGEPILIDMGDVCKGHPLIEVTNTFAAYKQQALRMPDRMMAIMGVSADVALKIWDGFERRYFGELPQGMFDALEGLGGLMSGLRAVLTTAGREDMKPVFDMAMPIVVENADKFKGLINLLLPLFNK